MPICYECNVETILGPGDEIPWPAYTDQMDFELEVGFFVGRGGRNISAEEAPALQAADDSMQARVGAIQNLVEQRDALRASVAQQVAHASARVQQEKDRLAALLSELHQSVVVCNLDGRVLLYNQQARQQFQAALDTTTGGPGLSLLGIGRSIHGIIDRAQVEHALDG